MLPLDLTPPAGPQYAGGLSFMRTVQPVLDRYCIKCHGLEKMEKDVDLVMDDARYPKSYMALIQRGDHRLGQKGYKSAESYLSRPYEFYAYSNKVPQMLLEGHGKLNVDRESRLRIIEWLDLNAQCYGDLFPNKLEHRRLDTKALDVLRGHIKEHFGEELAAQPDRALINVAQIDESRILMAPLSAEAGGWGQIDGWTSKDDPAYQEMVKLVEACVVKSDRENRGGWEPTLETGAGEDWVVKAREAYLGQFDEDVPTEQPTP